MTITICTDRAGRITALVVPVGACATVIEADPDEAVAARFGGPGERIFKYDPERDAGLRESVPRGSRTIMNFTVHDLTVSA